jgi:hypothetical protein
MDIVPGIPYRYLYFGCILVSFLMFYAGGTAFEQNPFYGGLFFVSGVVLFFGSVRVGRVAFGQESPDGE